MDERQTLKDVELQQHYDRLFDLFATPAWKEFISEVERFKAGRPTIGQVADAKALHFVQGQLDVIGWTLGFEERTTECYKLLLADDNVEAEEDE